MAKDNDDLSEILFRRARKHAKAQAKSAAKLKQARIPRRDDLNRAAYYVLLLTYRKAMGTGEVEQANRLRRRMMLAMEDALFDPGACARLFEDHAETVFKDIEAWVGMRRIARNKEDAEDAEVSAAE